MSFFYEELYVAGGKSWKTACGLKRLIIEIGKCEFEKKRIRAIDNGRLSFVFPTNAIGKKSKRYKIADDLASVKTKDFYKEGIYRINKVAKMGQNNVTAIKRLVRSKKVKAYSEDQDEAQNVFLIHRIRTSAIYNAILVYLRRESEIYGYEKEEGFEEVFKRVVEEEKRYFAGAKHLEKSQIITKPYAEELASTNFWGQKRIMQVLLEYDR